MVKFILLGHGRSGSTLLVKTLLQHSRILMEEELFHPEEAERFKVDPHPTESSLEQTEFEIEPYRDFEDGAEFLTERVFCERENSRFLAVGFKMFYTHARENKNAKTAWDYLTSDESIHVVHLVRTNILATFLSLKMAFQTGEWRRWKGTASAAATPLSLRLEPAECEQFFNQIVAHRLWAQRAFQSHPFLEIYYENDVCSDFENTMFRIYDFLNVPREPARELLEKQASRRPADLISNYDELRHHFRHTLFESFFEVN
jgi:LPS sulfotransferase NodH